MSILTIEALDRFKDILRDVACPPYTIAIVLSGQDIYLQVSAMLPDNTAQGAAPPVVLEQKGRKWRLSVHMTRSEVVQTALKACLAFEEHELRERFKYRGRSIFDPHYDVDLLHSLRGQVDALDERTDERMPPTHRAPPWDEPKIHWIEGVI